MSAENAATPPRRLSSGQRVRFRNTRDTGRVTGTWKHPGDEFHAAQPGVMVTMDNQFSPRIPVRHQAFESDFTPLRDDYLDDTQAMEAIARTVTHIPGNWADAAKMLRDVMSILDRNERISEDRS